MTAELVELGPVPAAGGSRATLPFAGLVTVLVALLVLAVAPGISSPATESAAPGSGTPAPVAAVDGSIPIMTPGPWAWRRTEADENAPRASVERIWTVGDSFIADVRSVDGPDVNPASKLLMSTDGVSWKHIGPPASEGEVEAAVFGGGRLWVIGRSGPPYGSSRRLWSTDGRSWQLVGEPDGLTIGPGDVEALSLLDDCAPDGECDARGWVAAVRASAVAPNVSIRHSRDGLGWREVEIWPALSDVHGITTHVDRWVIVATYPRAQPDIVETVGLVSDDRRRWTTEVISRIDGGGVALAAGVAGLVLVGAEQVGQDTMPRAWLSQSGDGWIPLAPTMAAGRVPDAMAFVSATERGYVALSRSSGDAWLSTNGEFWRDIPVFQPNPGDRVRALASIGDVVLAGGQSGDGIPTFWAGSLEALTSVP
jgi:hypothetical protein